MVVKGKQSSTPHFPGFVLFLFVFLYWCKKRDHAFIEPIITLDLKKRRLDLPCNALNLLHPSNRIFLKHYASISLMSYTILFSIQSGLFRCLDDCKPMITSGFTAKSVVSLRFHFQLLSESGRTPIPTPPPPPSLSAFSSSSLSLIPPGFGVARMRCFQSRCSPGHEWGGACWMAARSGRARS